MRVIVQRVRSSTVTVNGTAIGQIERGLNLLIGIAHGDTITEVDWMVRKILSLRLFPAEEIESSFQLSVQEIGGEILAISQFTLYADCRKGRRPSFEEAASSAAAEQLYENMIAKLRQSGLKVETGRFGADMKVEIVNDGPVTLLLEKGEGHN